MWFHYWLLLFPGSLMIRSEVYPLSVALSLSLILSLLHTHTHVRYKCSLQISARHSCKQSDLPGRCWRGGSASAIRQLLAIPHYTCVEAAPCVPLCVLGVFIGASLAAVTAPIGALQQQSLSGDAWQRWTRSGGPRRGEGRRGS